MMILLYHPEARDARAGDTGAPSRQVALDLGAAESAGCGDLRSRIYAPSALAQDDGRSVSAERGRKRVSRAGSA